VARQLPGDPPNGPKSRLTRKPDLLAPPALGSLVERDEMPRNLRICIGYAEEKSQRLQSKALT
jgi:hypothetical protein